MIDQITVFLENAEGRLSALCRTLAEANVNMSALTIADTADYGVVRIICDDPALALDALNAADYRAVATKVSAIAVPNEAGGLSKLLDTLDALNLNIEYGYCFSSERARRSTCLRFAVQRKPTRPSRRLRRQASGC